MQTARHGPKPNAKTLCLVELAIETSLSSSCCCGCSSQQSVSSRVSETTKQPIHCRMDPFHACPMRPTPTWCEGWWQSFSATTTTTTAMMLVVAKRDFSSLFRPVLLTKIPSRATQRLFGVVCSWLFLQHTKETKKKNRESVHSFGVLWALRPMPMVVLIENEPQL